MYADAHPLSDYFRCKYSICYFKQVLQRGRTGAEKYILNATSSNVVEWNADRWRVQGYKLDCISHASADGYFFPVVYPDGGDWSAAAYRIST